MHLRDFLKLHFIVLIFGFTAILGKLISVPAVETVIYRTGITAFALGFIIYFSKTIDIKATKATLFKLFAIGFLVAIHWILFFGATKVSKVSICLVGISTTSFWTALIEPILTDKKFNVVDAIFGLVIIIGIYIVFQSDFGIALGLFMGMASALFSAIFSILNSRIVKHELAHQHTITALEMLGAFVGAFVFLPFYKHIFNEKMQFALTSNDVLWLLILSLVCTVYAYSASVELLKRISAFTINLTINLEPVYGIILAIILFPDSEKMTPTFYMGSVVILATVLLYPVAKKRFS